MDLTRCKGQNGGKMDGPDPGGQQRRDQPLRGVAGVAQKAVGAYLLERPSGVVVGLKDLQTAMAEAQQTSGEDYSGDWGERHDEGTGRAADLRGGLQRRLGRAP